MRYTDFMDCKTNIQRKIENEWIFTCNCARCSDPSEFESNLSSFKCVCGGFYYSENSSAIKPEWKCTSCLKVKDLRNKYKDAEELITTLSIDNIDDIIENNKIEQYHSNFYVTTKSYIKYIEKHKSSEDIKTINTVVDKVKILMSTLSMIDGGCTRLNGKYLMILMTCQQKLLMFMNKEQEIGEKDLKTAMMEITKGRLQAAKMMSPFMIRLS